MNYKLIAMDMDGTLLDEEKLISKRNLDALKRAYEKGIHIALSTGRNHYSVQAYTQVIGVETSIICNNGAYIKFEDGTMTIIEMDQDLVMNTLAYVEERGIHYNFVTDKQLYYFPKLTKHNHYYGDNKMLQQSQLVKYETIRSHKDVKVHQEKIMKIHIFESNPQVLKEIVRTLPNKEAFDISSSGYDVVELCHKNASKGLALESLADYYKIPREEVMAIGDGGNDVSMIQFAGLGIAMANGMERAKESADYITASNQEDGVAQAIEKFAL